MRFANLLVVSALFVSAITAADTEDGVLELYDGSSDLPDSIAFGAFLDLVHATREEGNGSDAPIVAKAIGHPLDDRSDTATVRSRSEFFDSAYKALKREKMVAEHSVLCSRNPAEKSTEDLVYALNAVDDVEKNAKDRQFIAVMNALDAEERTALLMYLNELKQGIWYARIDSATQYDVARTGIRTDVVRRCADLEIDIQMEAD